MQLEAVTFNEDLCEAIRFLSPREKHQKSEPFF